MPLCGGHAHRDSRGGRMSSRTVQIVGGPSREHAWVDASTNALLVKVVNPGGGGGGSSVQYNEDTAHVSGDTGTMALVVRKDTPGALAGTDGDYAPLQVDASGALRVVVVSGGGSGGTQFAEDAAHASGDLGTLALVVRQDTPGSLVNADGDYAALQVDATGRLRVAVDTSVALSISNFPAVQPVNDNGGSLTVDGTVGVTQATSPWVVSGTVAAAQSGAWSVGVSAITPGTGATDLGKAEDAIHVSGDVGVMSLAVRNDALTPLAANGDYVPLMVNGDGSLVVFINDGLVAVSSLADVIPGTGAVNLGKAEDAVHASGDVGVMSLAVRKDAVGTLAGTDGDYAPLQVTSLGALRVAVEGTVAATQSGSWGVSVLDVVPGTLSTNLGKADGAAYGAGDTGVAILGVDTNTGNYGVLAMSSNRAIVTLGDHGTNQLVSVNKPGDAFDVVNDAGIPPVFLVETGSPSLTNQQYAFGRVDTGGALWVNVKTSAALSTAITSVIPGTGATNLGKAEDAGHTTGDVGVMALAVRKDVGGTLAGTDLDYAPLQLTGAGALRVSADVTNIVTINVQSGATIGIIDASTGYSLGVYQDGDGIPARTTAPAVQFELVPAGAFPYALTDLTWQHGFMDTGTGGILTFVVNTVNTVTTSVIPGSGGSSLGKVEDGPHNSGDTGVAVWAVRTDTATQRAGTDGDYSPFITDASGRLHVNVGTVTPGTGATNLGKAEDAQHTTGDTGVFVLAVRQDTMAALADTDKDYAALSSDRMGRLRVFMEGGKVTYRAATTAPFVAAAGAAMFFAICGSSTKTIYIQRIRIAGLTLTAVAYLGIVAEKWSTAPTGGTATALTKVPTNSSDAAATANLCSVYTAAPTEGTLVGTVAAHRVLGQSTTAAAAGFPDWWELDFRNRGENTALKLAGTAETLSLAFAAAPASAVTMSLEVEWTEE